MDFLLSTSKSESKITFDMTGKRILAKSRVSFFFFRGQSIQSCKIGQRAEETQNAFEAIKKTELNLQ